MHLFQIIIIPNRASFTRNLALMITDKYRKLHITFIHCLKQQYQKTLAVECEIEVNGEKNSIKTQSLRLTPCQPADVGPSRVTCSPIARTTQADYHTATLAIVDTDVVGTD